MVLSLRPSEIRYSQDSIGNTFGGYTRHPYRQIGCTLDDILTGRCSVEDIPTITVSKRNGKWYTGDNRRLWVFRKAEEFDFIDKIPVYEGYINGCKFTTFNEGISVRVRGYEGGQKWRSMSPKIKMPSPSFDSSRDDVSSDKEIDTSDQKHHSETVNTNFDDSDVCSEIEQCSAIKTKELPAFTCIENDQNTQGEISDSCTLKSKSIDCEESRGNSVLEQDLRESVRRRCQVDNSFVISQTDSSPNLSTVSTSSEVIIENCNDVLQIENPAFENSADERVSSEIISITDVKPELDIKNRRKTCCCIIL